MNKILNKINSSGICYFPNIFSKNEVQGLKGKLKDIYKKRKQRREFVGRPDNQLLWNYFYDDNTLLRLIEIPKIDKILKKLLDKDYVLQSAVAQNHLFIRNKKINEKGKTSWHTDSRYLGGQRLSKNFGYLVIIALDDFTKNNGATYYIDGSLNLKNQPKRNLKERDLILKNGRKLKIKRVLMKAGSVCIMNTGIWHKAGKSSNNTRWSIFNIYTGWFVKPYFKYNSLYNLKIKKNLKKLLHFYSQPPEINEIRNTLIKK